MDVEVDPLGDPERHSSSAWVQAASATKLAARVSAALVAVALGTEQDASASRTHAPTAPMLSRASAHSSDGRLASAVRKVHSLRASAKSVRVGCASHWPDDRQVVQRVVTSLTHAASEP